jgi:DNA primase
LVVEGYFDLLALYNQAIPQVVAPLGTALTLNHVRMLSRLASRAVLVFDGDEAGMRAAMRSLEFFLRENLPVRFLPLPEGMDPDDYVVKEGRDLFMQRLREAKPLMDVFLEQSLSDFDGTVDSRLTIVRTIAPMLSLLDSRVAQEGYLRFLDQRLGVSEETLRAEMGLDRRIGTSRTVGRAADRKAELPVWEEEIIRILVHYPNWIPILGESSGLDSFQKQPWMDVARLLDKHHQGGGNLDLNGLLMDIQDEKLRNLISSWSMEVSPWREDDAYERLREYLTGIGSSRRRLQDELKRLKKELQAAEQRQDQKLVAELLGELQAKKAALLAGEGKDKANVSKGEMV